MTSVTHSVVAEADDATIRNEEKLVREMTHHAESLITHSNSKHRGSVRGFCETV